MRIRWRGFELPTQVNCDETSLSSSYGRFVAEPFERGFGITIGNGLRRILLSSLEGAAVTAVRIKGAPHQFMTLEGVYEDVIDIILNIKKLILKLNTEDTAKILRLQVTKKGMVTAADITSDPTVEILNPDLKIATLVDEREFMAEMMVKTGRGYVTAEENAPEEQEVGLIPIDTTFSPVVKVTYHIENTRVGQRTDYDRLVMEIWTKGTITPEMALVEASKIYRRHIDSFIHYFELGRELQVDEKKEEESRRREEYLIDLKRKLAMPVTELDLSVRSSNCLSSEKMATIGDLVTCSEQKLLKVRNFGKTSLKEVKRKLAELGLSLGMDLQAIFEKKE